MEPVKITKLKDEAYDKKGMMRWLIIGVILAVVASITVYAIYTMATTEPIIPREIPNFDRAGNPVSIPAEFETLVTIGPSNTEIVVGLGLGGSLIAIDTLSADVSGVPAGLPLLDFESIDAETLIALGPDIVIASGLIIENAEGINPLAAVAEAGAAVLIIPQSESAFAIANDIAFIGAALDAMSAGAVMSMELGAMIAFFAEMSQDIANGLFPHPGSVYIETASAPYLQSFGQGVLLQEFIELMGADNIFAEEVGRISVSGEQVISANPDVIITNVNRADAVYEIMSRPGWENISAVANGRVYQINPITSTRPSQYIIYALDELSMILHPDFFRD